LSGALLAMPPASVLAQVAVAGVPVLRALHGMAVLAKIQALAVDENNRGRGLGAALVSTCLAICFQAGYQLAYGQFRTGSGLEHYYRGLGFSILDTGQGISLRERLGLPIGLTPETSEQFFLRWRD
jgi:GNAT superfamily N-acetyltransferase